MIAAAALAFQVASCLGWGGLVLSGLGLDRRLPATERVAWAFAAGTGTVGWLAFWPGVVGAFSPPVLAALLAVGLAGLPRLRGRWDVRPAGPIATALAVAAVLHLGFHLLQALSPPVDADTLAYHYDLPRRFLEAGRIVFVPRAVDGAVPLLVQMTYASALALGGERALGLWAVATTWGAAALVWALARPHAGGMWAAAAAILFVGTPAALYGAITGQVEVRLVLFALLALGALAQWWQDRDDRWLALAGLACGYFMASKFTGLLFAAAIGGVVLLRPRQWRGILSFGTTLLVAGSQWYGWNFVNSGDPVFPMLYGLLGPERVRFWTAEANAYFHQAFLGVETPLAHDLGSLLAYPWLATFAPLSAFEAGRTGLGPTPWVLVPFAATAAFAARRRLTASPLLPVALALLAFYGLWFFLGGSQRVRHLVPLLPAALLLLIAAADRWATRPGRRTILALALAGVMAAQAAGGAFAARWFVQSWGKSRDEYYGAVIGPYPVARWANAHLGATDRLLNPYRDINYLLDVPFYHAHSVDQALIDLRQQTFDPARLWRESRALGITHAVVGPGDNMLWHMAEAWIWGGCAKVVATVTGRQVPSRTLGGGAVATEYAILQLVPTSCSIFPMTSSMP